ncbi:MAG: glycosyltransferase N-terminal domain-containing protein [Saprospiraceae bacterium]
MSKRLWFFIYDILIRCSQLFIFIGQFFNPKLKLLFQGRKNTLTAKQTQCTEPIWLHCASLGEFEQGRPLIEAIKKRYPTTKILLTFFSPSGYEIQKNYTLADEIQYLPSDTVKNAQYLIEKFRPKTIILVKYEFWWRLLDTCANNQIPIYSIASLFRKNQYFFSQINRPCVNILSKFHLHFVQDEMSSNILSKHNIQRCTIVGDPRIDRVIQRSKEILLDLKLTNWIDNTKNVVVYGSVWLEDLPIVIKIIDSLPEFKHIIAPHDIHHDNIDKISSYLNPRKTFLYSDEHYENSICLVNNIGKLNSIYSVAKFAYIGGGFGGGIHNTLEAAIFEIPIIFGPKYKKFNEANYFISHNIAFAINDPQHLPAILNTIISDTNYLEKCKWEIQNFFNENAGATQKIINYFESISLLSKEY